MPYQHTNRRGEVYDVQAKDRGGKLAYSATRKPGGTVVDHLPEGYEIYEKPENSQVFVRKIKPTKILPVERELVESSVRKLAKLEHFIVEATEDSVIIHLIDTEPDATLIMLREIAPMSAGERQSMHDFMVRRANYTKMMRFMLLDEQSRAFSAERWCFLGGIDNWYYLSGQKPLRKLVEKYVPHLGRESFFELG